MKEKRTYTEIRRSMLADQLRQGIVAAYDKRLRRLDLIADEIASIRQELDRIQSQETADQVADNSAGPNSGRN